MQTDVAVLFIEALQKGANGTFERLGETFSDDVEFTSAVNPVRFGPQQVIEQLEVFQTAGRFRRVTTWTSETKASGVQVTAQLPLESFYSSYVWDLSLAADGKVAKIVQTGVAQTEPLTPSAVQLNEEISHALQIARESRNPVIVAYVNREGQPRQAPRGTVQVFTPTQLALWVHNPRGGLLAAIQDNPRVSLHYWGGIGTTFGGTLLFLGRAHIAVDEQTRRVVYNTSPASEQRSDPERAGSAVIVELEEVSGFLAGTRYNMSLAAHS